MTGSGAGWRSACQAARLCALGLGIAAGLWGTPASHAAAPTPSAASTHRRPVEPIGARRVAPLGAAKHAGRTITVRTARSLPR
jgi:hypothetical protein